MKNALRLLGILMCIFLMAFTGSKLFRMAQIRGFISGPAPVPRVITDKITEAEETYVAYWLAWDNADIKDPGRNRVNLPKDVWDSFSIGDTIDVIYFPGHRWPYHRKDVYAGNGNFALDSVLFLGWIFGIVLLSFQTYHSLVGGRHGRRSRGYYSR